MLSTLVAFALSAQIDPMADTIASIRRKGLTELGAYSLLTDLTVKVGARVSGSEGAATSSPTEGRIVLWSMSSDGDVTFWSM